MINSNKKLHHSSSFLKLLPRPLRPSQHCPTPWSSFDFHFHKMLISQRTNGTLLLRGNWGGSKRLDVELWERILCSTPFSIPGLGSISNKFISSSPSMSCWVVHNPPGRFVLLPASLPPRHKWDLVETSLLQLQKHVSWVIGRQNLLPAAKLWDADTSSL